MASVSFSRLPCAGLTDIHVSRQAGAADSGGLGLRVLSDQEGAQDGHPARPAGQDAAGVRVLVPGRPPRVRLVRDVTNHEAVWLLVIEIW